MHLIYRSMDSSLLDDGMILGETFCTQYRLDKAKARILAMDKIITPVMSFAEVMQLSRPVYRCYVRVRLRSNFDIYGDRAVLRCRLCPVKHLSKAQLRTYPNCWVTIYALF